MFARRRNYFQCREFPFSPHSASICSICVFCFVYTQNKPIIIRARGTAKYSIEFFAIIISISISAFSFRQIEKYSQSDFHANCELQLITALNFSFASIFRVYWCRKCQKYIYILRIFMTEWFDAKTITWVVSGSYNCRCKYERESWTIIWMETSISFYHSQSQMILINIFKTSREPFRCPCVTPYARKPTNVSYEKYQIWAISTFDNKELLKFMMSDLTEPFHVFRFRQNKILTPKKIIIAARK